MSLFLTILAAIGITLLILAIIWAVIFALLLGLVIWLIRKHPIVSLFILIIILVIATAQLFTPVTIVFGVTEWVAAIIALSTQYKRLKKAFS